MHNVSKMWIWWRRCNHMRRAMVSDVKRSSSSSSVCPVPVRRLASRIRHMGLPSLTRRTTGGSSLRVTSVSWHLQSPVQKITDHLLHGLRGVLEVIFWPAAVVEKLCESVGEAPVWRHHRLHDGHPRALLQILLRYHPLQVPLTSTFERSVEFSESLHDKVANGRPTLHVESVPR